MIASIAAAILHSPTNMRRILMLGVLGLAIAGCSPADNEGGGTRLPGEGSGAPLNDEAVGPSDQQEEVEEDDS